MRALATVLAIVLLLACGARSDLLLPGERDGSSGAAAGSGGDGGGAGVGAGGAGGDRPPCRALQAPLPLRSVAGDDGIHQRTPQLLRPAAATALVSLTLGWQVAGPAPTPIELRHVSFTGWPSWPASDLAPVYLADFDRGVAFESSASSSARIAALASGGFSAPFAGLALLDEIVADAGDGPTITMIGVDAAPLMLSLSGETLLLGYRDLGMMNSASWLRRYDKANVGLYPPVHLGCASIGALPMDAIARGDGWLVAAASVDTIPDPCVDTGPLGPALRMGIATVDMADGVTEIGSIEAAYPLEDVRLTPSDDGVWLIYEHAAPGGILTAARLDASGHVTTAPFEVEPVINAGFDAASLGDKLAVAWATSLPSVEVALFDVDGTRLDQRSVALPGDSGYVDGPPALVSSPDGDSVILAFSHAGTVSRVRVTRIDCVD